MSRIKPALILAALLASGCSLHLSAELLNPLNKGGEAKQAQKPVVRPTPRPAPKSTPFPRPWGGR